MKYEIYGVKHNDELVYVGKTPDLIWRHEFESRTISFIFQYIGDNMPWYFCKVFAKFTRYIMKEW